MFELLRNKHADTIIAVVGASNNTSKYGSIITRKLCTHGYTVWPVNPHRAAVHGLTCYPSVANLPGQPAIVNVVTPPEQTIQVLNECVQASIQNVWMQEGSYDRACVDFARTAPFAVVHDACIMVIAARY